MSSATKVNKVRTSPILSIVEVSRPGLLAHIANCAVMYYCEWLYIAQI